MTQIRVEEQDKKNRQGQSPSFFIHTFGCQMNESDSEHIAGLLISQGWQKVELPEKSNLAIINTCAVRAKSVDKFLSLLGRLKEIKKKRDLKIAIVGCVAQLEGENLLKLRPEIDYIFGPDNYLEILKIINHQAKAVATNWSHQWREHPLTQIHRESQVSAYVPVMEGCNNFCTYCIVPFVRGREKYRPARMILEEIKRLADQGFLEVQLLGQSITSYHDPESGKPLAELLQEIAQIDGLIWIRFITSHPKNLSKEIAQVMATEKKICRQLHLPVQSGSNSILKKMNRGYTREEYLEKIAMLRELMPDISLSTDIIVGFPGETEKDFEATLRLLEEVRFSNIFSFRYSPRPLTAASRWVDDVPFEVKRRRLIDLQNQQKKIQLENNATLVGQIMNVLCIGRSQKTPHLYCGRNEAHQVINFASPIEVVNKMVKVKITSFGPYSLQGELVAE
ncbi:MAG: tRNA (N6-isopentenyl adenosine(37)-C2)-methylthiotransferase MiaB [Candidatus Aminicenantes bacterium]|nr:tRNA (N6-isopentenyl adenosine(37)-C2)-methylthiotransferase MiaB [Candidatus Aminicenantes bacterium]